MTTAVPDASSSAPGASRSGICEVESKCPPRRTVGLDKLELGGESLAMTLGWWNEFSKRITVLFGDGSRYDRIHSAGAIHYFRICRLIFEVGERVCKIW